MRGTAEVHLKNKPTEGGFLSLGSHKKVTTLQAGAYFGEDALLKDVPRTATIVAGKRATCFVLTRPAFQSIVGSSANYSSRNEVHRKQLVMVTGKSIERKIPKQELVEITEIGTGTFSKVRLVQHEDLETNKTTMYALKVMKSEMLTETTEEQMLREVNIMKMLDHPFVLKLVCEYKDTQHFSLLLEFVTGGELFAVIHTPTTNGVALPHCQFYSACIMNALGYLHEMGVIYRDLKPENIMIDESGYAKIIDFGFAKNLRPGGKTYTLGGTAEYLAPEILSGRGYTHGIDWWAFGTYQLISQPQEFMRFAHDALDTLGR